MDSRLTQGTYTVDTDEGWRTLRTTSPSELYFRNPGMGFVGYVWEENGPSLNVRNGQESLENSITTMAASPYVDALYIRCDWRDVQSRRGKLDLHPMWKLTLDAVRKNGLPVGFRVQLSSPNFQPGQLAVPDFVRDNVPLVNIGRKPGETFDYYEPRYDHPAFQSAFLELNELLAAEFDGDPTVEFMDLMMYGFWGEGHSSGLPHPFPDDMTAERTMMAMAEAQMDRWTRTQLVVNAQTDISRVGNLRIQEEAVRRGYWLRVDSVIVEEPWGIGWLSERPAGTGLFVEDGTYRHYIDALIPRLPSGMSAMEDAMKHVPDIGGHYWSLWTEGHRFEEFHEANPDAFPALRRKIGYRVRPAWVWQRMKGEADEIVVGVANDGCGGIPGRLRIVAESADGTVVASGFLDAGAPAAGRTRLASFLVPTSFGGRELRLRAELELRPGVMKAVQWCCGGDTERDGSVAITLRRRDEEGWRKGI